jgi:hypothetical protein
LLAYSERRTVRMDTGRIAATSTASTAGRTIPLAKSRAAPDRFAPLPTPAFPLGTPCFVKH